MTNDAFSANDTGLPNETRRAVFALPAVALAAMAAPGALLAGSAVDVNASIFAAYLAKVASCDVAGLSDGECATRADEAYEMALRIVAEPSLTAQDVARKVMIVSCFGTLDLLDGSELSQMLKVEIAALAGAEWQAFDV